MDQQTSALRLRAASQVAAGALSACLACGLAGAQAKPPPANNADGGRLIIRPVGRSGSRGGFNGRGRFGAGGFGAAGFGAGGFGRGATFSFDFHGSDILNVLRFYSRMANATVVADPSLSGQVTIINPEPVDLNQAFTILQQVLAVRGFTAIQNKDVISIEPFATASKNTPLLNPGVSDNGPTPVDPRDQVMTQVIPLENVDAESLAKDLQPLINTGASLIGSSGTNALILTDRASNVERIISLAHALDKASDRTELRTYPLKRAEATSVADIINNVFKQLNPRSGPAPMPGQPGFNPQAPQAAAAAGQPAVLAVPDASTNTVLVVASPDNQERVANEIINRLDGNDSEAMDTQIRKINFADASHVANLINTVLSSLHGQSASSTNNSSFQQRVFPFFFGGGQQQQQEQPVNSTDPLAQVTADPTTNSVVITATPERMKKINALIDELDKQVPDETTTFVFPLKNANATDVAYALQQAFNTGQQTGFGFGNTFINGGGPSSLTGQTHTPIQRRLGQSGSSSPFGRAVPGQPPVPPVAPDQTQANQGDFGGVPGVMTPNGFVPTGQTQAGAQGDQSPLTRQFFGGRFGGQQSLSTSNGPQYGVGRGGVYSNLLQLQNNVFVTAAPGGDSLIVTTLPQNYEAVKQIIDSLDVVPQQVMIDVIVAQVTLDKDQKLGFSLMGMFKDLLGHTNTGQGQINLSPSGFNTGTNGVSLDPTAAGAQFVISGANYGALLQALESDNRVKVLARPHAFTTNTQPVDIEITTNIPYISGQTFGGFTTTVSNTIATQKVGYTLYVTPRITRGAEVTLDVIAEATDLQRFETLGSGANASLYPIVDDRYEDTEATVQDGATVVLGGLMSDSTSVSINRIPLLSDIPLIGQLFRSREKITDKTELLFFVTPHVVSSPDEERQMTLQASAPMTKEAPELKQIQPNLAPPTPAAKPGKAPTQKAPAAGGAGH